MEAVYHPTMQKVNAALLYALRYFSLFKYPLTQQELYGNISFRCCMKDVVQCLAQLTDSGDVFHHNGFYSTDSDIAALVKRRLEANGLAAVKMPKAISIGKLIALFPFVRFVGISGSLSKGYADAETDYDFFVITSQERLWVCRTILHLFKKMTFLFFQEHKFCMNYFIDVSTLQLEEQNIYTAIELSTMIPVSGSATYTQILTANRAWMDQFVPNPYKPFYPSPDVREEKSLLKRTAELILDPFGRPLNTLLMKVTDKRWRRKWRKRNYPEADYTLAFKTTLHHSKNHPANYQKWILSQLSR
jgi:hypothetical protein